MDLPRQNSFRPGSELLQFPRLGGQPCSWINDVDDLPGADWGAGATVILPHLPPAGKESAHLLESGLVHAPSFRWGPQADTLLMVLTGPTGPSGAQLSRALPLASSESLVAVTL